MVKVLHFVGVVWAGMGIISLVINLTYLGPTASFVQVYSFLAGPIVTIFGGLVAYGVGSILEHLERDRRA